jgi:hypothetical protein
VGRITWDGQNSSNARASYARIQGEITANTAGAHTGALNFYTATAGAITEKMCIAATGNVGIGTSSPSGASGTVLEVNGGAGQARFVLKNNTTGSASTDGSQIALVNSQLVIQNRESSEIIFETDNVERARISAAGLFQYNNGYGSVATAFGCRAWINFDGTGTPAARASGNVSSITDNGTGDYTINFTNAMPDGNYAPVFGYGQSESAAAYKFAVRLTTAETGAPTTMTTTALRVISGGTTNLDFANLYVAIFR